MWVIQYIPLFLMTSISSNKILRQNYLLNSNKINSLALWCFQLKNPNYYLWKTKTLSKDSKIEKHSLNMILLRWKDSSYHNKVNDIMHLTKTIPNNYKLFTISRGLKTAPMKYHQPFQIRDSCKTLLIDSISIKYRKIHSWKVVEEITSNTAKRVTLMLSNKLKSFKKKKWRKPIFKIIRSKSTNINLNEKL